MLKLKIQALLRRSEVYLVTDVCTHNMRFTWSALCIIFYVLCFMLSYNIFLTLRSGRRVYLLGNAG